MSLEELRKAILQAKARKEVKEVKPKPIARPRIPKEAPKVKKEDIKEVVKEAVKEVLKEEGIAPEDWATEIYRAFFRIISGRAIRGSKEKAIRGLIDILTDKLVQEIGKGNTIQFLKDIITKLETSE